MTVGQIFVILCDESQCNHVATQSNTEAWKKWINADGTKDENRHRCPECHNKFESKRKAMARISAVDRALNE